MTARRQNDFDFSVLLKTIRYPGPTYYRFKNCSNCKVNVYWRRPNKLTYYNCLGPDQFVDVNTFVTHEWVFLNTENGNYLLADGVAFFSANPWREELEIAKKSRLVDQHHEQPFRRVIELKYPLQRLSYLALEAVRDTDISLDDVDKLEIPITLQKELRKMIYLKRCLKNHDVDCSCLTEIIRRNSKNTAVGKVIQMGKKTFYM